MRSIFSAALLGAMLSSTTAFAQALGSDEVSLKNGGSIRGTIVSVEPGNKVVILEFGAKEPRTLTWAEVADVQKGKYGAPEPGPEGPGYEKPEPKEAPDDDEKPEKKQPKLGDPGVVRLHVESPEPVQIFQSRILTRGVIGGYGFVTGATAMVCSSPCDALIETKPGDGFGVEGDMPSTRFSLDGLTGDVTARVEPGNKGARVGGIIMTAVGGAAILGGAATLLPGALLDDDDVVLAGGVLLGAGAGVLTGGIIALVLSRTTVEVTKGSPGPKDDAADSASVFEIDKRTVLRAPRYWLGEF